MAAYPRSVELPLAAAALAACAAFGVLAGLEPRLAIFAAIGLIFAGLTFADLTTGLVVLIIVVFAETAPVAGPALTFTKLAAART